MSIAGRVLVMNIFMEVNSRRLVSLGYRLWYVFLLFSRISSLAL